MANGDGLQPQKSPEWMDALVHKLRVEHPPKAAPPAVDWIKIAPYVVALLMLSVGVLGWIANRQIEQLAETAKIAASNEAAIKRIDTDRSSRIAKTDARLDGLDKRAGPIEALLKDVGRLETGAASLDQRLVQGREERLADTARMVDSLNALKTEVALLRQEQAQLRQSVEARGRGPDRLPFPEGNQRWNVLPFLPARPPLRAIHRDAGAIRPGGEAGR